MRRHARIELLILDEMLHAEISAALDSELQGSLFWQTPKLEQVLSTLFFCIEKMEVKAPWRQQCDLSTFQIFFHIEKGETILLPADSEPLDLPIGTYIKIYLPNIS